ncbi:MAG: HAMP domain-containing histidine kinase [Lachnospiraceae bacterium]|nr:HAMP domain-containing histidine kinase [Lachnospiraceae bacterium]
MLDTRLKNNKKAQRTAVVIVALAAACFALIAINCKYHIDSVYMQHGSDLESDFFIEILLQWNYVLYPEVLEKSGQSDSTEELYLSFEEETIAEVSIEDYYGTELVYEGSCEQLRAEYISELHNNLLRTDSLYTSELGMKLDYCVIDVDTQTVLKNTTREIELLEDNDNKGYLYYLIVHYDKNGNISDMRVSGIDSEQFLKNAQLAANSSNSMLLDERQRVAHYILTDESGMADRKVTVTQKNPQNVIFIYAMTEEQLRDFNWFPIYHSDAYGRTTVNHYIGTYSKEMAYFRVGRWYLLLLAVITILFGLLSRYRPQSMADTAGTRHCAELIWGIQWLLAVVLYSFVVTFVYLVNEVYFITEQINFLMVFAVMFVVFGVWYWCLMSIRDIFGGLRSFVKKRSLLYRYWGIFKSFLKRMRARWKDTLASMDLGKDLTRPLRRLIILQWLIVSLICCTWVYGIFIMVSYSVVLYFILKRHISKVQSQYRNLMQATNAIAKGKFDNTFEGDFGIFKSYKEELYQIQGGFRTAVEEEVKSQHMKTELITNVSHDLKTPLTAIITYIDLLKEENVTSEQRTSYLETLERKALRLKVLIEDLFEISKASSGNVRLEPVAMDICNLIRQVYLEHEDRMIANGLDMRFDLPEEKIILQLDSQKTYRIFENLYVNVTKYALPNTRVYVQAKVLTEGGPGQGHSEGTDAEKTPARKVHIEVKNISAQELTVNPTDLTERFVRGDASRNTEGSGLGLAIAKSFTELQGGKFDIEIDGDLFKAVIAWEMQADN